MAEVITQQEIDRLTAPFPLEAHSIREGNKVRGGQGIQWFVYVEKTEVEKRLNEVFPGEWGSTQPVLTVLGNSVAATIGITIRGITRGNTGEDSNGTEKAKGATTDAFRRAAADWGVAKYLWEMDFQIYTDSYPDKDWKARDAREKEALGKFAQWYKQKFQNVMQLPSENAPISQNTAHASDLAQAAGDYEPRTPKQALNGNGPAERTVAPKSNGKAGYKEADLWNAVLKPVYGNEPIKMKKGLKALNEEGVINPFMSLDEAIAAVKSAEAKKAVQS